MFNFIIYVLNDDINEADDVIANEHENECDIGYVNANVCEYDNEYGRNAKKSTKWEICCSTI